MNKYFLTAAVAVALSFATMAQTPQDYTPAVDARFLTLPTYAGDDLGVVVKDGTTHFALWSPEADAVLLNIYPTGRKSQAVARIPMTKDDDGVWRASGPKDLTGMFYTFTVTHRGRQLAETPGPDAKAVGINGQRAAIIDFAKTNPEGWADDRGPQVKNITDAVIYEMHHRDFSVHPSSDIAHKGKFLALTEHGTRTPGGNPTGIDHLKDLGVTHVHILPSFDYNSVDEANLPANKYNWGYDPANYNAPEGSYSTDPADPTARVRQFKEMVKSLHDAGIGVVMDVVYNHTAQNDDSNFSLSAPGYYYRHRADGTYSDASGCGNETASDRAQMRNFMINSLVHWAKEYHVDGFRFDLMAIHDIETMNAIRQALTAVNPNIIIYGEGWTAGDSPLPVNLRALKENVAQMPGIAVFSDDLRDAVKGHYSNAADRGFATGKPGNEETVKIGIVAATAHPQVDYSKGNNSKFAYAAAPTQIVNYVSCHDDMCLTDKLGASIGDWPDSLQQRAARLAQTIVFTSQGTPFMFAGEEVFRNKKGVHNTYQSPDSVNAIDWTLLDTNAAQNDYYRQLIRFRKAHPALRMTTTEDIARHLKFDNVSTPNLVSYSINGHANGDPADEIKIIFNGNTEPVKVFVPTGKWTVIAQDGRIDADGLGTSPGGHLTVPATSALILTR